MRIEAQAQVTADFGFPWNRISRPQVIRTRPFSKNRLVIDIGGVMHAARPRKKAGGFRHWLGGR